MSLLRLTSTKNAVWRRKIEVCFLSKHSHEALLPVLYDKCMGKSNAGCFANAGLENRLKRNFHMTKAHNDLEGGLRAIGAGLATMGAVGPGVGIGMIFQALVAGAARNPSSAGSNLINAAMGASFCEILGLISLVIGFMNLFG